MHHRLNKTLWAGLIVVALLVAGCGVSAQSTSTTRTSVSPTAKPALTWQKRALPPNAVGWDISPVTGRDGWACVPAQGGGFTILATHDAAVTWAKVSDLAPTTPEPTTSCGLDADQRAANVVIAVIDWGAGADNTLRSISLISTDSGVSWRQLPGEIAVSDEATVAGETYAILYDTTTPTLDEGSMWLVVSTDALRTWHATRPPRLDLNDGFFGFQLGAAEGEIVAASYNNTLWRTTDDGANWSQITTPDQQTTLFTWLSQANQWMFCGGNASMAATCSVDMGKTWQQYPALSAMTPCGSCTKGATPTQSCYPNAIADDGSLVAFCVDDAVYRLAPHANTWSALGTSPATPLLLLTGHQVWCFNATQGAFFVATLPF
jgi:hypothetical protein